MPMTGSLYDHMTWIEELRGRLQRLELALAADRRRAEATDRQLLFRGACDVCGDSAGLCRSTTELNAPGRREVRARARCATAIRACDRHSKGETRPSLC